MASARRAAFLETRALLSIAGPESRDFLQGVVSNDVAKVTSARAQWSALLTPQGKFLHEFFVTPDPARLDDPNALLLDCEAARRADLKRRLAIYKLRAKAEIAESDETLCVLALFGDEALDALELPAQAGHLRGLAPGGLVYVDPRLPGLGARALVPSAAVDTLLDRLDFARVPPADYDALRIPLGVPDGSRDLEPEKALLLENGFDELQGVDWQKGCFVGQELTARTKYRALIKKRLLPLIIDGPTPPPGTPVEYEGKEVGTLRSVADGVGLALLRLEAVDKVPEGALSAGGATVRPRKPDWLKT
jgi:folate-binding protein YgfZ